MQPAWAWSFQLPLPQGPRQIIFIRTLGKFSFALKALEILFFITARFFPLEKTWLIDFYQFFMWLAIV